MYERSFEHGSGYPEDDCNYCCGMGLQNRFCPECGKMDMRTPDEWDDIIDSMADDIMEYVYGPSDR